MKTIFFILFLLFAFNRKLPSANAQVVVDTNGDYVRNGGTYYLLPAFRGHGGGLGFAKLGNETCPLSVVQDPNEFSLGSPITISSPYRVLTVFEGSPLFLSFYSGPSCAPTTNWGVVETTEGWSVRMSDYHDTVPGWFKIQNYHEDYKLVFCPKSRLSCSNLGVTVDEDGNRRFVVTGKRAFPVVFKVVESEKSAI